MSIKRAYDFRFAVQADKKLTRAWLPALKNGGAKRFSSESDALTWESTIPSKKT